MDRPFYSVTFGDKNTWDEWNLMPVKAGKIEFATPEVKTEHVEVPGSDDSLDFTEVLTGYPTYDSRKGSVKFRFFNNGISARSRFNRLKNYLHGRHMKAVIEDEPDYYYIGRFMVGDFEPKQGNWGDVEISYVLNAYKLEITNANEDWLWDPFNFETGVIREYGEIRIAPTQTGTVFTVIGSRKPTVPKFTVLRCSGDSHNAPAEAYVELVFNRSTYRLPYNKTTVIPQIVLMDNEYEMTFNTKGYEHCLSLSIDLQGGSL